MKPRHGHLHRTRAFAIPGLPGHHPLTIYLPPGYEHSQQRYPVAYMFDGQNLFGDHGSYAGGWHMHQALDQRAARVKKKVVPIVVAIHHGGASRNDELSPWPIDGLGLGLGQRMLDWIIGPLRDMIAKDLRILTGPDHTMIGGSSLGGLLALYAYFRHWDVFGKVLCMSPSLWVNEGAIYAHVAHARVVGNPRIYLDCGGREIGGLAMQMAEWMVDMFERKGMARGEHFLWRPDKRGAHNERNWRRRLPKALLYLYG